jgi:type III secretion system FlhB-like substrate exporter
MTAFWWRVLRAAFLLIILSVITGKVDAVQLSEQGCGEYAAVIKAAAESRDVGADRDKYLAALMRKNAHVSDELLSVVRAEVVRVWSSAASPDDLYQVVLRACHASQGRIGENL